jgi:manganese/iron transport system ATP-binding protein
MPGARRYVDHVVLINRCIRGEGAPDEMLSDSKLAELAVSSIANSPADVERVRLPAFASKE